MIKRSSGMIRETLGLMSVGGTTLSGIAQELGTTQEGLKTLLGILERMGYVETSTEGYDGAGCASCPLSCCAACGEGTPIVAYRLTEKGKKVVES
ncbi:MAG: FeoC-like transcriptional regulator [Methermicoccaceae archaeon]